MIYHSLPTSPSLLCRSLPLQTYTSVPCLYLPIPPGQCQRFVSPPAQHTRRADFVWHTPQQPPQNVCSHWGFRARSREGSGQPEHHRGAPLRRSAAASALLCPSLLRMPQQDATVTLLLPQSRRLGVGSGSGGWVRGGWGPARALSMACGCLRAGVFVPCVEGSLLSVSPASPRATARWDQGPPMTSCDLDCFLPAHLQMQSYWGLVLHYVTLGAGGMRFSLTSSLLRRSPTAGAFGWITEWGWGQGLVPPLPVVLSVPQALGPSLGVAVLGEGRGAR